MSLKLIKLVVLVFVLSSAALIISTNWYTITYFARPVWDTPPRPFTYIPHYYAHNISAAELCSLHGWEARSSPRRVYDAVIFNNELDLLEIRWRELDSVVDGFLLIESNRTFTGNPKPFHFDRARRSVFRFAETKIHYKAVANPDLKKGQSPFANEEHQRVQMNKLIQESGIRPGDLLIMSDADEIPSSHTIDLLRNCNGFPSVLHLQMKNYVYSFEFFVDDDSWRSSVHVYDPWRTAYGHFRRGDEILADSGWHCSFCFRRVEDIRFKMTAYSHADRVRRSGFLDENRIQKIICSGSDLFDMLPEEFSYKKLIAKMGSVPSTYSAVHLPSHLLRNPKKFKFLLPGNCNRSRQQV